MKFSLAGLQVATVALFLTFGQGERPATATEARLPGSGPLPAASPASRVVPSPRKELVSSPAAPPSTLTPMPKAEARLHLAKAWSLSQGGPPSDATLAILCAHWAHETRRGHRMHAYNFGGIKGTSPGGGSVVIWTREGTEGLVRRTFRAYSSPDEGALDYVNLLAERYSGALRAARDHSIERFVSVLASRGYFTDDERAYLRSLAQLARECRSPEP